MIEGFTIIEQNGNEKLLTLSAKQLIHRKRKTQFFIYQNLKELYLQNTQILFSPPHDTAQKEQQAIQVPSPSATEQPGKNFDTVQKEQQVIPFELIGKSFESFGSFKSSIDEVLSGEPDINLDILSRVIFDGLSMIIVLPDKKQFSIQADIAIVPTDFRHLVFTGNVRMESGTGQIIAASQAVWSCKDGGFFFPNGHILENRQDNDPAFYNVMLTGALTRRNPTLFVDYADPLETKEKEFQEDIAKGMPIYARLIFGLPLPP
jgi:hypothetical protein